MPFIKKNRTIKGPSSRNNKIDDINIIDTDSTRFVKIKSIKFNNLVQQKKLKIDFVISITRLILTKLRQVFIKSLIFSYFDLNYYIQIKTDILSYVISGVLNQLTVENLDQ